MPSIRTPTATFSLLWMLFAFTLIGLLAILPVLVLLLGVGLAKRTGGRPLQMDRHDGNKYGW